MNTTTQTTPTTIDELESFYETFTQITDKELVSFAKKFGLELQQEQANVIRRCSDTFKRVTQLLFKIYPNLYEIRWKQYTPYFNDGDPCYFTTDLEYATIILKNDIPNTIIPGTAECEDHLNVISESEDTIVHSFYPNNDNSEFANMRNSIIFVLKSICDDFYLEHIFGNDVQISIRNDQTIIKHYNHE